MIQYTKQYKKSWQREMKIGDWVWLNNYTKRSGLSPKLQIKWELVPYKISQFLSEVVVEIHQHGTNKKRVVHINKLKRVGDQERWNGEITPKKPINRRRIAPFGINAQGFPQPISRRQRRQL